MDMRRWLRWIPPANACCRQPSHEKACPPQRVRSNDESTMLVPSPGAPAIEFRSGSIAETIPRSLVNEAILALPDGSPATTTLRRWLGSRPCTLLDRDELSVVAAQLLDFAHSTQSELGILGLLSSRAGGRLSGQDAAPDDDVVSAATVLALAIERFVVLTNLASSVAIADISEGAGQ